MVSVEAEVTSFRDLVTSLPGAGFVVALAVWTGVVSAGTHGFIEVTTTVGVIATGALILILPFAYLLHRDLLMWVVTRPPLVGGTLVVFAGLYAGFSAVFTGSMITVDESPVGLIGVIGACLLFAAIPAIVAFVGVMLVHGSGGRSSGPEAFPEE